MTEHKPDIFQQRALETWHGNDGTDLIHATLGLAGEVGEVVDNLKKRLYKSAWQQTREQRLEEYGDVLFYLSILLNIEGATFEEVSARNYEKLTKNANHHGWKKDEQE